MKHDSTGPTPPTDQTDWPRVRAMSDAEIQHDTDSPRTTLADWEGAVLRQGGMEVGRVHARGPNRKPTKQQVAIRLSPEVLEYFKSGGAGWQTRIDEALKDWVKTHPR